MRKKLSRINNIIELKDYIFGKDIEQDFINNEPNKNENLFINSSTQNKKSVNSNSKTLEVKHIFEIKNE